MSILDWFESDEDRWQERLDDAYHEGLEAAEQALTEGELQEAFDNGFGDGMLNG